MGCLLPVVGHVEADPALALRLVQDLVHRVQHRHRLVHVQHLLLSDFRVVAFIDYLAIPEKKGELKYFLKFTTLVADLPITL